MFHKFAILFLCCISLVIAQTSEFSIERALPEKTLAFMTITDIHEYLFNDFNNTGLYKMFSSPEFQALYKTLNVPTEKLENIKHFEQMLGVSLDEVKDLISSYKQFSIAIVDFPFPPIPSVVISLDLGTKKQEFITVFDKLKRLSPFSETPIKFNEQTIIMLHTPMPIYFTYIDNTLVICSDKNLIESMITTPALEASLSTSNSYKAVKENVLRGQHGELLYVNLAGVREIILKKLEMDYKQEDEENKKKETFEDILAKIEQSGLNGLDAFAIGSIIKNKQIVETLYLYTPKGRTGVLNELFPVGNLTNALTPFIPKKIMALSHGFLDLSSLYTTGLEIFQLVNPGYYEDFKTELNEMEGHLSISTAEFFKSFGKEFLFTMSCSGGLIPDVALQMTLDNKEKFEEIMTKLMTLVPRENLYSFTWNDHKITYFNFSTKRNPIAVAPAFAIADGRFLFGLYPQTVKNLLLTKEGSYPEDLVSCMEDQKQYIYAEYWNIKPLVMFGYQTLVPLFQAMAPRHKLPFEPGFLPCAEFLQNHLTNVQFLASHTNEGVVWEMHSPTGMLPMAIIVGVGLPALGKLKEKAERKKRGW
jgi:hypothetical protein